MHTGDNIMKMLDLINEAETDKEKNLRHTKDLDSLEREIRKSKDGLDKDTQAHIDKKRKELAANKAKIKMVFTGIRHFNHQLNFIYLCS